MFERKTVFVIGAGASRELNLPVGEELMKTIAEKLDIRFRDGLRLSKGDALIASAVEDHCRTTGESRSVYFNAGRAIAAAMSQAMSIDNYLHAHAHDSALTYMGKLAIAQSIIEAERSSYLYDKDRRTNLAGAKNSWLVPFFQMMHGGVTKDNAAQVFENVSLICFNYDRCIEHFLRAALAVHFRIDEAATEEIMQRMSIVHPYGEIGRISYTTPFGTALDSQSLRDVEPNIRTFTEQVDEAAQQTVRVMLEDAEVVVFLGFSYNQMNLEFMGIERENPPRVFGTALGLSDANIRIIAREIDEMFGVQRHVRAGITNRLNPTLDKLPCRQFLIDYQRPIMRGR